MTEKLIRVLTWATFGLAFVLVVFVALLASLTGRPLYAQTPGSGGVRSKVKVSLPQADAELFIEKRPTKTTGLARDFDTPEMERGKRYEYELRAVWNPNPTTTITRTRTIKFNAGDEVVIDLAADDDSDLVEVVLKPLADGSIDELVAFAKPTKSDVVFVPNATGERLLQELVKAGAKRVVALQADPAIADKLKASIKGTAGEGAIDVFAVAPNDCRDYAEATLVLLHLGDVGNLKLRPRLLKQCTAETRIVSYRGDMGDWKPDRSTKGVDPEGLDYQIHAWTVTDEAKQKYAKK